MEDKLPKICSQLIFKRLLTKLTKESTFLFQGQLYKQSDGCTMGGPLSVTIADIYMTKLEESVVIPTNPTFYKRYVDDSFNRRKKGNQDTLFDAMNKVHTKINFTVEVNPTKFLDTEIVMKGANVETKLIHKETKLPTHWSTKTPKKFKRNAINGNLHRAWMISSNFEAEVKIIRDRFLTAKYPLKFINSVVKNFREKMNNKQENQNHNQSVNEDDFIIPPFLFELPRKVVYIELPFCFKNEKNSKKKIHQIISSTYR